MVTNKTESAVYWAFAWTPNWDLEVPARGDTYKVLPNETKKYQFYTALIPSKER